MVAPPSARETEPANEQRWFHDSLWSFLRSLSEVQRRFWLLVVAVGVAAGAGAALLMALLGWVEALAWPAGATLLGRVEAADPLRRVGVLAGAGLLVVVVANLLRQPTGGHGTAGILASVWTGSAFSLRRALTRGVLSIVVVGMGAPLGREGALMSTGAGLGWFAGRRLGLEETHVRLLIACGASAGIAAAYNVPIGGALFGLEVILGSFALELFGPVVVCCVVSTLVSRTLLHAHAAYLIPEYELGGPVELLAIAIAAPFLGVASSFFVYTVEQLSQLSERSPGWIRPALPVLVLAGVGVVAIRFPEILGNGYEAVDQALQGELPITLLFALPFIKLVSSGIASGSGVPGGLFTPSLFFGALLGGGVGAALELVWAGAPPAPAFALVGMGAALAGTTHATMAAVLIIFEMTRDYAMVLPLLIACFVSTAVSRSIVPHSIYTGVLRRRGVSLPTIARPGWLDEGTVEPLVRPSPQTVEPGAPFSEIAVKLLELPWGLDLHVVDGTGRWLGTASLAALKAHVPDQAVLSMVIAADVMNSAIRPLTPQSSLAEARERLARTQVDELPVVDADGRLIGTVRRHDLARR